MFPTTRKSIVVEFSIYWFVLLTLPFFHGRYVFLTYYFLSIFYGIYLNLMGLKLFGKEYNVFKECDEGDYLDIYFIPYRYFTPIFVSCLYIVGFSIGTKFTPFSVVISVISLAISIFIIGWVIGNQLLSKNFWKYFFLLLPLLSTLIAILIIGFNTYFV